MEGAYTTPERNARPSPLEVIMTTLETPLLELTAEDLMSRDVLVISQHMSLKAAAHLLAQAQVSGAPVVDEEGRCVGVLSAADLIHWVDREGQPPKRCLGGETCACCDWQLDGLDDAPDDEVSRYMTTNVVATGPETRVGELARWMRDAHIHRIVIVDERRRPVGVVSGMDVLAAVARLDCLQEAEGL
jgi:CBS-domain-containing membrane protein